MHPTPPEKIEAAELCCGSTLPFASASHRTIVEFRLAADVCPTTVREAQAVARDLVARGKAEGVTVVCVDITDMREWHKLQGYGLIAATTPCQSWSGKNKLGTTSPGCLLMTVINLSLIHI